VQTADKDQEGSCAVAGNGMLPL